MCPPRNIDPETGWVVPAPPNFKVALFVPITLYRRCRKHIPTVVYVDIKALLVKASEMATHCFQWFEGRDMPGPLRSTHMAET